MSKCSFWKKVILVLVVLILSSMELSAGSRDHNGGFFLRLSTGAGYAQSEYGDPSSIKLYGAVGDVNIAVGMAVLPNMALHATMFGWASSDLAAEIGGSSIDFPGDVTLGSFGIGFTYYLMPVNI
ncbi:MAG: hypothetical protein P8Z50_06935, partial [candidate division WOR-3 bacterium]